jgi:hypothetical protein
MGPRAGWGSSDSGRFDAGAERSHECRGGVGAIPFVGGHALFY